MGRLDENLLESNFLLAHLFNVEWSQFKCLFCPGFVTKSTKQNLCYLCGSVLEAKTSLFQYYIYVKSTISNSTSPPSDTHSFRLSLNTNMSIFCFRNSQVSNSYSTRTSDTGWINWYCTWAILVHNLSSCIDSFSILSRTSELKMYYTGMKINTNSLKDKISFLCIE